MGGSHSFWDEQVNVKTGLKGKNLALTTVSEDYVAYLLASLSLSTIDEVKTFMHRIEYSFYARFGNPLNEVLTWSTAVLFSYTVSENCFFSYSKLAEGISLKLAQSWRGQNNLVTPLVVLL